MKKDALVDLLLGKRPHLDDALSYYAEVALVAQDELLQVRSRANPRAVLPLLESTDRGGHLHTDQQIINVSVPILLHARGTGAHPPSE